MAYQLEGFLTFYVPHQCQKHLLQISAWALFPLDTCCSIIKIKRLKNKKGWQRTKRRRKSIPEDLSPSHSQQEQACWVDLAAQMFLFWIWRDYTPSCLLSALTENSGNYNPTYLVGNIFKFKKAIKQVTQKIRHFKS